MKGYNGYFLLEYLIDQSMRADKIIYNGSIVYAQIPPSGYNDQYSKASIQWLEWTTHVNIETHVPVWKRKES